MAQQTIASQFVDYICQFDKQWTTQMSSVPPLLKLNGVTTSEAKWLPRQAFASQC
jgi:hypothetical protein